MALRGCGSFRVTTEFCCPITPGFGESAHDPTIGSLDDYVSHYVALFDLLQLSVPLIGASFGGFMAAHFAMAHPERVGKLILAAPFGLLSPEYPWPLLALIRDQTQLWNRVSVRKLTAMSAADPT